MSSSVGWVLCAAATAVLYGCATHASPDAPPTVSLAGNWRLDHAASDDPEKVLAKMRAEAFHLLGQRPPEPPPGRRVAPGADIPAAGQEDYSPDARGHRPDPLRRSPMARIILDNVARGDFLTIHQGPGEFVLDYGGLRRSFTPGQRSVVSTADGGVGDQTSGWKGAEYVIELKAQMGPSVTESYGLSGDRKRLIEKLHIGSAELPAVELTRVYDPAGETAPHQLPIND
jgi:hypothetical protein